MRCGHNVVTRVIRIISLPPVAGMLWSAVRWITGCHGATFRIGGGLCLCQVNALDGQRQRVLLGAQFAGGLLQCGHLGLNRVDVVQPTFHGPQVVIHGRELFGDGGKLVVSLATQTLASNRTHGGSENPGLIIPRCRRLGRLGESPLMSPRGDGE
jgi:hypothetical protein